MGSDLTPALASLSAQRRAGFGAVQGNDHVEVYGISIADAQAFLRLLFVLRVEESKNIVELNPQFLDGTRTKSMIKVDWKVALSES